MNDIACNDREDLQFFGRICASVSHDIKNVLAVVNEGAGLLADLSMLADKGVPLDPAKLRTVANSIQSQIRRGDTIVKGMNAFAHSVDEHVRQVDLTEVLQLVVTLARRLATAKSVTLEIGECDAPRIRTDVYSLEYLLHGMITHALAEVQDGGTLTYTTDTAPDGVTVTLAGAGLDTKAVVSDPMNTIARKLGARLQPGDGTLELLLPQDMS